jgi:prepilin-type N-terminal cleavage/methylation domain-containing protein/prepilin-type processing-associated H-X9-DG protein
MRIFPAHPDQSSAGFTLVEVLAVLTVGALLMALVLPAARNALESSRSVRCAGNLRQLGQLVFAYGTDHNGDLLPTLDRTTTSGTGMEWMNRLRAEGYLPLWYNKPKSIMNCPSRSRISNTAYNGVHYGMNWYPGFYNISGTTASEGSDSPHKLINIIRPSQTLMLAETNFYYAINVRDTAYRISPHNGSSNIIFFDGHMASWKGNLPTIASAFYPAVPQAYPFY